MSLVVYYADEDYEHMCFRCAIFREQNYGSFIRSYASSANFLCEACADVDKQIGTDDYPDWNNGEFYK